MNNLQDMVDALPGLEDSLSLACSWLVDVAQVKEDTVPPEINPRKLNHKRWAGAFRGEYRVSKRQWSFFCPVWHGGQAVKALTLARRVTSKEKWLEARESMRSEEIYTIHTKLHPKLPEYLYKAMKIYSDRAFA